MNQFSETERSELNILAISMLQEARSLNSSRIYSATGFSRDNISILHQQIRCINLAWALKFKRRIKKGNVASTSEAD
jgi:hypothetical protein